MNIFTYGLWIRQDVSSGRYDPSPSVPLSPCLPFGVQVSYVVYMEVGPKYRSQRGEDIKVGQVFLRRKHLSRLRCIKRKRTRNTCERPFSHP